LLLGSSRTYYSRVFWNSKSRDYALKHPQFRDMPLPAIKPFSIKVFFADSEPRGLRLLEKSGWNGFGAVCPRQRFGEVKNRGEFGGPGVYLLLGDDAGQNLPGVYIGEADSLVDRITHHVQNKIFGNALSHSRIVDSHLTRRTCSTWSTE
jgi:hypothetical protein